MKKEYIAPQVEVYSLQVQGQLLNYSGGGLNAREFIFDEDEFETPEFGTRKSILDEGEDI